LAQKWHPSIHPNDKNEAIAKYREITEAYEVLSEGLDFYIFKPNIV
jgi:DnaJ-class molecular chaperone